MTIPIDVLEAEALGLPQADRSRLEDRLLASLGHEPQWEQAWSDEADRRGCLIANGQAQWVDGPEAVARVTPEAEHDLADPASFCRTQFGRLYPMARCPFSILYRVEDRVVRNSAIAHPARRPEFGQGGASRALLSCQWPLA